MVVVEDEDLKGSLNTAEGFLLTSPTLETRSKHGWLAGKGTEGVSEGRFSLFMFVCLFESFAQDDFQPIGNQ